MPLTETNGVGDASARPGERRVEGIPKKMKALQYSAPEKFAVVEIDVPEIKDDEVLVKITACGVCGTDLHYHKGEFLAKFPLIPGHEITGIIAALGRSITSPSLTLHAPITIDPLLPCRTCTFCLARTPLLCTALTAYGGNVPGGFAQYAAFPSSLVHALPPAIPPLEAVLLEPAACALHGIERAALKPGARVLLFGCGPTGLLLAQLLRLNGCAHLTIASAGGPKLELARGMGVADVFVELPSPTTTSPTSSPPSSGSPPSDPPPSASAAYQALHAQQPEGYDAVIEATGSPHILSLTLPFVRKGGTLLLYGVYPPSATVTWSPFSIWEREITILASFCSMQHTPQVLEYVRSGRLRLAGVVDRVFRVEEWGECLGVVGRGECVKAAVVFE